MEELLMLPDNDHIIQIKSYLNEDSEKFENCLKLFQNWLVCQKHLPQSWDKNILQFFIRYCKMDMEKVKRKFELYCYNMVYYQFIYENRIMSTEHDLKCLEYAYCIPLPRLTATGQRIFVFKVFDTAAYDVFPLMRYCPMLFDFRMHKETMVSGDIIIADLEFMRPQDYIKSITATFLQLAIVAIETYPSLLKMVLVVCCHPLVEQGINVLKKAFPEKIRNRFYFLERHENIRDHLPTDCLPSDYGGSQKSLKELSEGWKNLLKENEDFLQRLGNTQPFGPMPKRDYFHGDQFGIDGCFRKLNID